MIQIDMFPCKDPGASPLCSRRAFFPSFLLLLIWMVNGMESMCCVVWLSRLLIASSVVG